MMGHAPRQPIDLQTVTRDVKDRVRRVIGELEAIEQQKDPIFRLPARRVSRTHARESRTRSRHLETPQGVVAMKGCGYFRAQLFSLFGRAEYRRACAFRPFATS
jgi:hypothetical protein